MQGEEKKTNLVPDGKISSFITKAFEEYAKGGLYPKTGF